MAYAGSVAEKDIRHVMSIINGCRSDSNATAGQEKKVRFYATEEENGIPVMRMAQMRKMLGAEVQATQNDRAGFGG